MVSKIARVASLALICGVLWPAEEPASSSKLTVPYVVATGTKIPLMLLNGLSTKHSAEGDRVYLTTSFPIVSGGRVVIPPGSFVAGTVTRLKRPGRVKGRGELFLRFDALTLPNGVTREFRSRVGSMDGDVDQRLDRKEGNIHGESNKTGDLQTVGDVAAAGASVGALAASATGSYGKGAAIGGAAGMVAGVMTVLLTRGPDVVLNKGTSLEMVLDRELRFDAAELKFEGNTQIQVIQSPTSQKSDRSTSRRFPGL